MVMMERGCLFTILLIFFYVGARIEPLQKFLYLVSGMEATPPVEVIEVEIPDEWEPVASYPVWW